MTDNHDALTANHAWWQERALLHPHTPMYRPWLAQLRRGASALRPLEAALAGDVTGLRVLHVPCHIGHDTLSWALLGAEVTGVDFSQAALAQAQELATELKLDATWVHADACQLPASLDGRFDLVVATYGAYGWMYDLQAWVDGIARALVPGGRFLLVDGHPLFLGLDPDEAEQGRLVLRDAVMGGEPVRDDRPGTYADPDAATTHNVTVGWCHGIGDVCRALVKAGFSITHLDEHDHCVWKGLPNMVAHEGGYRLPDPWHGRVPLMWSLVATKG